MRTWRAIICHWALDINTCLLPESNLFFISKLKIARKNVAVDSQFDAFRRSSVSYLPFTQYWKESRICINTNSFPPVSMSPLSVTNSCPFLKVSFILVRLGSILKGVGVGGGGRGRCSSTFSPLLSFRKRVRIAQLVMSLLLYCITGMWSTHLLFHMV